MAELIGSNKVHWTGVSRHRGRSRAVRTQRDPRAAALRVSGLTVANPAASFTQPEMLSLLGLEGNAFAERVFANAGVEQRQFGIAPERWHEESLQGRSDDAEDQLLELALEAVAQLGADPDEIGTVVTATYYSLGGPTLAHRLVDSLGLGRSTDKYHLVGVGCASAVPLFRLAGQSLAVNGGPRTALVVAAESVSGFLRTVAPEDERTKIVGSALFADGCAAALLTRGETGPGPAVLATRVHQVADTMDAVRFVVSGADSYMHMSRDLPQIAQGGAGALVDAFLADNGLGRAEIDHWLIHPGGRGIIDGVRDGLELAEEELAVSREVLAAHGNMGTPSSFYVLRGLEERVGPKAGARGLMLTIGPGVTVGLMLLRW